MSRWNTEAKRIQVGRRVRAELGRTWSPLKKSRKTGPYALGLDSRRPSVMLEGLGVQEQSSDDFPGSVTYEALMAGESASSL
jgi:hypothetical protein